MWHLSNSGDPNCENRLGPVSQEVVQSMEPRPQSSRSPHEQSQHRQPPSGGRDGSGSTGEYQQQPDPSAAPPPRGDYDYSPLDLAPPGQRRRRQLVAAGLGGLVVLLLAAAVVFAIVVLGGDDSGDESDTIAASQTEVVEDRATVSAKETIVAQAGAANETSEDGAAGAADGESATEPADAAAEIPTTTGDQGGNQAAVDPTPAAGNTDAGAGGAGPTAEEMQALLPEQGEVPEGLDGVEDNTRTEAEVIDALGGGREVETLLNEWGWTANVERKFEASSPETLSPDATTSITVSLHGFADEAAAAEALTYYTDVLAASGYEEAEAGDIGAGNRLLMQTQEDGGTVVALYVQQGSVLYRVGGYSPAGDPTSNVLNVAQAMLAQ